METASGPGGPGGCLATGAIFLLMAAPVYLVLAAITRMARAYYGFGADAVDDGPPLRICAACHNTVLEPDYVHCPYCGAELDGA